MNDKEGLSRVLDKLSDKYFKHKDYAEAINIINQDNDVYRVLLAKTVCQFPAGWRQNHPGNGSSMSWLMGYSKLD